MSHDRSSNHPLNPDFRVVHHICPSVPPPPGPLNQTQLSMPKISAIITVISDGDKLLIELTLFLLSFMGKCLVARPLSFDFPSPALFVSQTAFLSGMSLAWAPFSLGDDAYCFFLLVLCFGCVLYSVIASQVMRRSPWACDKSSRWIEQYWAFFSRGVPAVCDRDHLGAIGRSFVRLVVRAVFRSFDRWVVRSSLLVLLPLFLLLSSCSRLVRLFLLVTPALTKLRAERKAVTFVTRSEQDIVSRSKHGGNFRDCVPVFWRQYVPHKILALIDSARVRWYKWQVTTCSSRCALCCCY